MNRKQRKSLLVAGNLMIVTFSGIAATTATVAWYNFQTSVSAAGPKISCTSVDRDVQWNILRYNEDTKSGEMTHDSEKFKLSSYDQYITEKNLYSNVILKATVLTPAGFLYDSQMYIDITCDGDLMREGKINDVTSNVCQFKASVYSYTTSEGETFYINEAIQTVNASGQSDVDEEYKTASAFFKATTSAAVPFTTIINNTPSKDRDKKITVIPRFNTSGATVAKFTVYLECSYDPTLAEYYAQQQGSTGLENIEAELRGDITEIKFRYGEKVSGSYRKVENQADITYDDDYMITYDDLSVALDGSRSRSNEFNNTQNYIPVEVNRSRIRATETVVNSDFKYTNSKNLQAHSGVNIGATSSSVAERGMVADASVMQNELSYQNEHEVTTENRNKYLSFDTTEGNTWFNYYADRFADAICGPQYYKYEDTEEANAELDSLEISGVFKTNFNIGDIFTHDGIVVHAKYSNASGQIIADDIVTQKCAFTNYNMNLAAPQTVYVSYTEDGVTATAHYQITVTSGPSVSINPPNLYGLAGDYIDITAIALSFNESEGLHYHWECNNTDVCDVEELDQATVKVTYIQQGPCIISCTVTDCDGNTDTGQCIVSVSGLLNESDTFVKVTSTSAIEEGDYLIVYEADSRAMNAAADNIDTDATGVSVAIGADGQIAANDKVKAAAFHINPTLGTIYSPADAEKGREIRYLYGTSSSATVNTLNSYQDKAHHTFSIEAVDVGGKMQYYFSCYCDGAAKELEFNTSVKRFRYYKSGQQRVCLYKLSNTQKNLQLRGLERKSVDHWQTVFHQYDNFTFGDDKAVVMAVFNTTKIPVTSSVVVTGYDMDQVGEQTVTLTYAYIPGDPLQTKSISYEITVLPSTLQSIRLDLDNFNANFDLGDTFSTAGIKVYAKYQNLQEREITDKVAYFDWPAADQVGTFEIGCRYIEGGVTCIKKFNITVSPIVNGFKRVTGTGQLKVGDHVAIVATDYNYAMSTTQNANNRGITAITKNGEFLPYDNPSMAVFTVGKYNDNWTFFDISSNKYLTTASNSANYLRSVDTTSANASFTVDVSSSGVATIKGAGSYTRNLMRYNKSSNIFSCYSSGQLDITLYSWRGEWTDPNFHVKSISTTKSTYEIEVGSTDNVVVNFNPSGATNKNITYQNDHPEWASIDENGVITANSASNTFWSVTIVSEDNPEATAVINIYTFNRFISVTSVEASEHSVTLDLGDNRTHQLYATVLPVDATNQLVHWSSSDDAIVSVTEDGLLEAHDVGNVIITLYADQPGFEDEIAVVVSQQEIIHVTGITASPTSLELNPGNTETLTGTVSPADAAIRDVRFISNDPSVCTVDSETGVVTAVAIGNTTVKVYALDNSAIFVLVPVTVVKGAATTPEWTFVDPSDLGSIPNGAELVIAAKGTYNYAMGAQGSNIRENVSFVKNGDGTGTLGDAHVFRYSGTSTNFTLYDLTDNSGYIAQSKDSNNLYTVAAIDTATNTTSWKFSVKAGFSQIQNIRFTNRYIQYNAGSPRFAGYKNTQQDLDIYMNTGVPYASAAPSSRIRNTVLQTLLDTYNIANVNPLDISKNISCNLIPIEYLRANNAIDYINNILRLERSKTWF